MSRTLLGSALATALAAAAAPGQAATPSIPATFAELDAKAGSTAHVEAARVEAAGMYIVQLADPALAAHDGTVTVSGKDGKAMAPTAPAATGARKLDVATALSKAYLAHLDATQASVLAQASRALGKKLVPTFRYRVALNGFAVELAAGDAAALRALPGVVSVEPERIDRVMSDAGPQFIGADAVWNGTVVGSNVRTKGEGVVVGVIDTGIYARHPSFADVGGDGHDHANPRGRTYGLCLTSASRCNDKLIGIFDFTTEGARDGSDLDGHGTHVASTAAGNVQDNRIVSNNGAIPLRLSGVAPHANVISYKACVLDDDAGGTSSCPNSATLAAIEQAIVDQVDVINYSIGGDPRDPWASVRSGSRDDASAFLNARAAGIVGVVAAGNEGPGDGTVTAPSVAPWVIAVANVSHDRRFANAADAVSGPGIAPRRFDGVSVNGAAYTARIVDGADYGNAACSRGEDIDSPPTGASNPFAPGTFNGEIVLCRRGVQARVAKGFNVRAAGAGGMILYNSPAEGEAVVADDHFLPATHLGNAAGVQLVELVRQARAAGGELRGTITATKVTRGTGGGVLSPDSGRGPVAPVGGFLKPNIAAPGTSILAADFATDGLAVLSGTSMASPHVAGAIALLAAANPQWSVSQLESALLTTANPSLLKDDAATRASALDVGAGLVNVPNAVRAGLSFNVSRQDFVNADPQAGGSAPGVRDPSALNLPSMTGTCTPRCTFTRTVTANRAGTWNASVAPVDGLDVTVEPASFTLAAGASRAVTVSVGVIGAPATGRWNDASVLLVSSDNSSASTSMPLVVFGGAGLLPTPLILTPARTSGYTDVTFPSLPPLANARFLSSTLARPTSRSIALAQDATNGNPYDDGSNVVLVDLATRGSSVALVVETAALAARDVDLFVGLDRDNDGEASADEALCSAKGAGSTERCVVVADAGVATRAWVVTQVFSASAAGATDSIGVETAVVGLSETEPLDLTATVAGRTSGSGTVPARVSYAAPFAASGQRHIGVLSLRERDRTLTNQPVSFTPTATTVDPIVLVPGRDLRVTLAPNTAHDRLILDVPTGASRLTVQMSNTGSADLYVARSTANEGAGGVLAVAPQREAAQGVSTTGAANEEIVLTAPTLTAGRWYVTPVNTGVGNAEVTLRATTEAANAPVPGDNNYFNPARSGHGTLFYRVGSLWLMYWYTYLEDRTPVWYFASGPAPADGAGVWNAPLLRFTWDGARTASTPVGEVTMTMRGADRFAYSWRVDGQSGSEPFEPTALVTCPSINGAPLSVAGSWYAPSLSGYGFNIITAPAIEVMTAYLYDDAGRPRWMLGSTATPGLGAIPLTEYRGFCPTCAYDAIVGSAGGTFTRNYASATNGNAAVDATFVAPVVGRWQTSAAIEKLTATAVCR